MSCSHVDGKHAELGFGLSRLTALLSCIAQYTLVEVLPLKLCAQGTCRCDTSFVGEALTHTSCLRSAAMCHLLSRYVKTCLQEIVSHIIACHDTPCSDKVCLHSSCCVQQPLLTSLDQLACLCCVMSGPSTAASRSSESSWCCCHA